jgi:hypothetical protein
LSVRSPEGEKISRKEKRTIDNTVNWDNNLNMESTSVLESTNCGHCKLATLESLLGVGADISYGMVSLVTGGKGNFSAESQLDKRLYLKL